MCSLYVVHGILGHNRKKQGSFCFVFCYYSLCHQLIFQKLMGQQKLILCEAAVMGTLHRVEHFTWGQCQCGEQPWLWISGGQESDVWDMAKTLLKVMISIEVSQVTFLSLHLSVFWSSVCSATATKVIGECWHLKNEEPIGFGALLLSSYLSSGVQFWKILFRIVVMIVAIVLWNCNWTVGFSFPEVVSSLRGWL